MFGGENQTKTLVLIILHSAPLHALCILDMDFPKVQLTGLPSEIKMMHTHIFSNTYRINAKLYFSDYREFLKNRFQMLEMT